MLHLFRVDLDVSNTVKELITQYELHCWICAGPAQDHRETQGLVCKNNHSKNKMSGLSMYHQNNDNQSLLCHLQIYTISKNGMPP